MPTKIEWTDETWNPITGCSKVSQGCKHCYAEGIAERFWGERKFTDVRCHPERLEQPLNWKKPRRVFVNSMSDLFHDAVPDDFIRRVYKVMWAANRHTFQVLTKRPERAKALLSTEFFTSGNHLFGANIWLGVSVENQKAADERIPLLLQTPAAVRFLSVEPMLGEVDLIPYLWEIEHIQHTMSVSHDMAVDAGDPAMEGMSIPAGIEEVWEPTGKFHWVIAGCESGSHARPMDIDWVRSLRDQCKAAGVPFFLKQMMVDGKITKMPELDGKVWAEYPGV